jgi:hypothetical protein
MCHQRSRLDLNDYYIAVRVLHPTLPMIRTTFFAGRGFRCFGSTISTPISIARFTTASQPQPRTIAVRPFPMVDHVDHRWLRGDALHQNYEVAARVGLPKAVVRTRVRRDHSGNPAGTGTHWLLASTSATAMRGWGRTGFSFQCLSLPWVLYVIRFGGYSRGFVTWINRYTSLTLS